MAGPSPDLDATTAQHALSSGECELFACWPGGSQTFALSADGSEARTLVIGRGTESTICLPHSSVSRKHAVIYLSAPAEIEDLGSANGTRIDGSPVLPGTKAPLPIGAVLEVGDVRAILRPIEIGGPSKMDEVRDTVDRIAPSDISVVIYGETGAGKEVLAEEIHNKSRRASGPFLRLNCAALAPNLLESELFGYERGAFTGANQSKPGLFESAEGGTVLLDEIGELPLATQPKLLRVLESREAQRIGALRPRPVDVRFLCATHRDLEVMTVLGQFRQDLLFRLSGITVQLPPLRDRSGEIPALVQTLLQDAGVRAGKPGLAITRDALALLLAYRWPGNIRELKNVLERAVLLATDRIDIQHIVFNRTARASDAQRVEGRAVAVSAPPAPVDPLAATDMNPATPAASENDAERDKILSALERFGGNQTEAAKFLGITRRMLTYRLDKLDIKRPRKG